VLKLRAARLDSAARTTVSGPALQGLTE
jgi:hypothetical protein